jgi:hypothetical protein
MLTFSEYVEYKDRDRLDEIAPAVAIELAALAVPVVVEAVQGIAPHLKEIGDFIAQMWNNAIDALFNFINKIKGDPEMKVARMKAETASKEEELKQAMLQKQIDDLKNPRPQPIPESRAAGIVGSGYKTSGDRAAKATYTKTENNDVTTEIVSSPVMVTEAVDGEALMTLWFRFTAKNPKLREANKYSKFIPVEMKAKMANKIGKMVPINNSQLKTLVETGKKFHKAVLDAEKKSGGFSKLLNFLKNIFD